MIELIYIEPEELPQETADILWKQGVNMDDWDYMLVCNKNTSRRFINVHWQFDKLLNGPCDNKWYTNINLWGKHRTIGIAYHS